MSSSSSSFFLLLLLLRLSPNTMKLLRAPFKCDQAQTIIQFAMGETSWDGMGCGAGQGRAEVRQTAHLTLSSLVRVNQLSTSLLGASVRCAL